MKERLIEDWLTKVNERGFEIPFCQVLIADGFRVLRVGHSPYEDGKDVIAVGRDRRVHAYQLKSGDLDLAALEEHFPQITALVESAVSHPSIKAGQAHVPCFVTTGSISDPAIHRVENYNASWIRRGFTPLTLVGGRELLADFSRLSGDFWPLDPPKVRAFLGLYLAKGKGDLEKAELAAFMHELLSPRQDKMPPKTQIARRASAVNIFTSYLLQEFYAHEDHWSIFCAWTIAASHIAWAAAEYRLTETQWKPSFDIAVAAATSALERIAEEARPDAFKPQQPELDDFVRARNTVAASAVAAWHLWRGETTRPPEASDAAVLFQRFAREGRFCLIGESSVPHFLAIIWFLERTTGSSIPDLLLVSLIRQIARGSRDDSPTPLPDAYEPLDDVLAEKLKGLSSPLPSKPLRANQSYALESLVGMAARRMLRQTLTALWYGVTDIAMASFKPARTHDLFLWRCEEGEEMHKWFDRPQSWSALRNQEQTDESCELPLTMREQPRFALLFLLVYPHRISFPLVRLLDSVF